MSLGTGINLTSVDRWAGIDMSAVRQVSAEIMQRADANRPTELNQANLNAFKRPELGVDLYNGRTSVETQRQISLTNTGLQIEKPVSTNFLNAQAATELYQPNTVTRAVSTEGLMQPRVTEGEKESLKELFEYSKSLEVHNTQKDRKGSNSNPFANAQESEETEGEGGLNIVC